MEDKEALAAVVQELKSRYYGKYRGLVEDNKDPNGLGRLKVKVPGLLGTEVVTGWAVPCVPYGGSSDLGFFFIPEKEAGVWVEFEGGDLEFPVWVGTYWRSEEGKSQVPKPCNAEGEDAGKEDTEPFCKIIKTTKGHTIQLDDADGDETLTIVEGKNKHVIRLDKEGIKVSDGPNKHQVTLDKEGIKVTDGVNEHEVTLDKEGIKVTDGPNKHEVSLNKEGIKVSDGVNKHESLWNGGGVKLTDGSNKHEVKLSSSGITVSDGVGGNTIDMTNSGIKVSDKAGNIIDMKAAGVTIKSNLIKVGGTAVEPLVLGNQLTTIMNTFVAMLNAHIHVGNLGAPTGPPTPPAMLMLAPALSLKHKTE